MMNLTPHWIVIRLADGSKVCFDPSGVVARAAVLEEFCPEAPGLPGVPVVRRVFGTVTGLPKLGEPCLVSSLILGLVPGREGVFAPDTGTTAIRIEGQVVAVTRLVAA